MYSCIQLCMLCYHITRPAITSHRNHYASACVCPYECTHSSTNARVNNACMCTRTTEWTD